MVSPIRPLLILFYVSCICLVIMVLAPSSKTIQLTQDFGISIFSLDDLTFEHKPEKDTLQERRVDSLQLRIDSIELAMREAEQEDSLARLEEKNNEKRRQEKIEEVKRSRQPIQFPPEQPEVMDNFFFALRHMLDHEELIRIVHLGDSQIEGDRISKYVRHRLQSRFGGCGIGLVPPRARGRIRSTIFTDYSKNWQKYAYIDSKESPFHNKLGLLSAYYRFTPRKTESDSTETTMSHAWAKFTDPHMSYKRSTQIENVKVLYRNPNEKLVYELVVDGATIDKRDLDVSSGLGVYGTEIQTNFDKATVYFGSKGQPDILGLCFDCNEGIAFDNVAIRGSSGVEFSKINRQFLQVQIQKMNVKLLIVQFGVNVVPQVMESYDWYERAFYRQLNYFKSLDPDLTVLVVGVSDMAQKKDGQFQSYPNIVKIRNAQRNAAFKAGCPFWDLYEMMGGQNAMVSWVNAKPALATQDYTHLNARGAKLVGETLYRALMNEYEHYKRRVTQ